MASLWLRWAALPNFRRFSDGRLVLAYTKEASAVMKNRNKRSVRDENPDEVSVTSGVIQYDKYIAYVY